MAGKRPVKAKSETAKRVAALSDTVKKAGDKATAAQKDALKKARAELGAERFSDLATKRLVRARKAIMQMEKLTGSAYKFTAEQAEKINATLAGDVSNVKRRFENALAGKGAKAADSLIVPL